MFKKGEKVLYTPTLREGRVLSTSFESAEPFYWIALGRGHRYQKVLVPATDLKKLPRTKPKSKGKFSQIGGGGYYPTRRVTECFHSGECRLHELGTDIWLVNAVWQPITVRRME
jgi:hypothetical protein